MSAFPRRFPGSGDSGSVARMIGRWIRNWSQRRMEREADALLTLCLSADRVGLGVMLASTTDGRHLLKEHWGWDLLRPLDLVIVEPFAALRLTEYIRARQRRGDFAGAALFQVWAHTLRASPTSASPRLKLIVRDLWAQLHLGDDYVEQARSDLLTATGNVLDIDGYEETPDGFRADRHPIDSPLAMRPLASRA